MVTPKKTEDAVVPEEVVEKPRMKRRDLLEVSALLRRQKLDPADVTAVGLGMGYLEEKRSGETTLSFKEWLDEDIPEDEDDEDDMEDPTES